MSAPTLDLRNSFHPAPKSAKAKPLAPPQRAPRPGIARTTTPIAKAPPKKVNKARKAKEFTRSYGSRERVRWIKAQPCCVPKCQFLLPSQNVHIVGGGAGRKASATLIVAMCPLHHASLHSMGALSFQRVHKIQLILIANDLEKLWRRVSGGGAAE